jgi:hypothetical protein
MHGRCSGCKGYLVTTTLEIKQRRATVFRAKVKTIGHIHLSIHMIRELSRLSLSSNTASFVLIKMEEKTENNESTLHSLSYRDLH